MNECQTLSLSLSSFVVSFGVELGCISSTPKDVEFCTRFDRAQIHISTGRFFNPIWKLCKFFRAPGERQFTQDTKWIDNFIYNVIEARATVPLVFGSRRLEVFFCHFCFRHVEKEKTNMI